MRTKNRLRQRERLLEQFIIFDATFWDVFILKVSGAPDECYNLLLWYVTYTNWKKIKNFIFHKNKKYTHTVSKVTGFVEINSSVHRVQYSEWCGFDWSMSFLGLKYFEDSNWNYNLQQWKYWILVLYYY